ncbi:MAG: flagellar hook-associated protein FlgK [Verrucomicrobiota bacterium]|nr:flagellar hook-associated protein FlgK [Verrucomicrobiota bacterium]
MLGLFGTLNMGSRSLSTQRTGIELAGHNMANANNPAYSRQRVSVETAGAFATTQGIQGTGADVGAIKRIRNELLDDQIAREGSVSGSLLAQQQALKYAQANLGQQIDRLATGAEGSAAANGTGTQHGIAEALADMFNSFQSLSTQPTSEVERKIVLDKGASLANRFNQTDQRLSALRSSLDSNLEVDAKSANTIMSEVARLNDRISTAELLSEGTANDLRDARTAKLEELAALVKFEVSEGDGGAVNISIDGTIMVSGSQTLDQIETYDAGGGQMMLRAKNSTSPLNVMGGSLHGIITARDGEIAELQTDLRALAGLLITEVNAIHANGYGLDGSSGNPFFTGNDASDIQVNRTLVDDPRLLQASGEAGVTGDNSVIVGMAQLQTKQQAGLDGQTFSQRYTQIVASLGESISEVNFQVVDQGVVEKMLKGQRDSISGVSLDEEMTDLIKYQKAFEASARLITTVDEMLDTVVNLIR